MNCHRLLASVLVLAWAVGGAAADYDATVRLRNGTGKDKADWPVLLTVWKVFGANLDLADLNPKGFHVLDGSGAEIPHMLRALPPDFSIGDDEIVFLVPAMKAGQEVVFRITNDKTEGKTAQIDLAASEHNLLGEEILKLAGNQQPGAWKAALDPAGRRAGRPALLLTLPVDSRAELTLPRTVQFKKDACYYFSLFARTENVAYNGWGFWNSGLSAGFVPQALRGRDAITLRGTRDWFCYKFDPAGSDDWGVPEIASRAQTEKVRKGNEEVPADLWAKSEGRAAFTLRWRQQDQPFLAGDKTGKVWLDELLLLEQPAIALDRGKALTRAAKNGVMVFTRPVEMPRMHPCAHEATEKVQTFLMPGERRANRVGLWSAGPLEGLTCSAVFPSGLRTEVQRENTEVELLGDYVEPLRPVDLKADGFAEYLVSFDLPPEARPATYAGAIVFRTGQTPVASLPLKVQVLPLAAPDMKGYLVGGIYNIGMGLERNEAFYRTYAKLHFNYLMLFDYLFGSTKGGEVDFDAAGKQVEQIVRLGGVTGGIGLYREPNMSEDQPRKWYQIASGRPDFAGPYKTGTDARFKEGYQKLAGQADQYARRHDWPTLVYMVSDEPSDSRDLDASMGWLKEAIPDAVTIADAQFADMVKTRQWYNLPVLDDPVDWTGPLVYQFVKAKAGRFGICGTGWPLEVGRYQPGLMLASSGACYWHFWHLKGPMEPKDGQVLRSHTLAAAAEGFNDLRYFVALKEAIARAKGTTQPAVAVEAEKYLASIFAFASADHDRHLYPYNGVPADWGCHRFYDNWRTRMKDFILALKK